MHTNANHLTDDELRRALLPALMEADKLIETMRLAGMPTQHLETLIELAQRVDSDAWGSTEHDAEIERIEEEKGREIAALEAERDALKERIDTTREALDEGASVE